MTIDTAEQKLQQARTLIAQASGELPTDCGDWRENLERAEIMRTIARDLGRVLELTAKQRGYPDSGGGKTL